MTDIDAPLKAQRRCPLDGFPERRSGVILAAMKRLLPLTLLLACLTTANAAEERRLSHSEWSVPRDAGTVLTMSALRESVQALLDEDHRHLLIRYPGGEEGTLWAEEVRAWLIALSIDAERIELAPGASDNETLELQILHTEPSP